jgi:hypothetical protein
MIDEPLEKPLTTWKNVNTETVQAYNKIPNGIRIHDPHVGTVKYK